MDRNSINNKFREYVEKHLSPTGQERTFISLIYESFKNLLNQNCLQIGSFPRFTSIRPIHDLDILYILGNWDEKTHNPYDALKSLHEKILDEYKNPTTHQIKVTLQTHSVTVTYNNLNEEIFSVDIIPGYIFSRNEFNEDIYKIPEISYFHHGNLRAEYYQKLSFEKREMGWITSDPRGYIEIAKRLNDQNRDFRKVVKIIKAWKYSCEQKDKDFKLKSFHLEQIITKYYSLDPGLEIFNAIFTFFVDLPENLEKPQIPDRADNSRYIDDYLYELSRGQKENINKLRDCFLIKLEDISESYPIENLIEACFSKRNSIDEEFLFDYKIPVLTDNNLSFEIVGEVQERPGFRKEFLSKIGLITIDRKIKFRIDRQLSNIDLFKWKVKNDNNSPQPRGEITDHQTRNDPETTKYEGVHYVECYAIRNGICVAKTKQNVTLKNPYMKA